jgi:hypothetical protein
LIQRVFPKGVVSLTQQLTSIAVAFDFVVGGGGGGGGSGGGDGDVWSRLCVLRLMCCF